MIELQGRYNMAKIFTDTVDEESLRQVQTLLDQPFCEGERIRMMPDIHAGAGCTIGTTMTVTDKIVPNLVGVDIGCGMEVIRVKETHLEPKKLDRVIREHIPSGFDRRTAAHRYAARIDLTALRCADKVRLDVAKISLGTLGGGNHFIEANRDEEGCLYVVVHSGSRHLGLEVANYYQEEAFRQRKGVDRRALAEKTEQLIAQYKAEGREKELQDTLKALKAGAETSVPKALAYCSGYLFDDYIHDMKIVQEFAALSRQAMTDEIVKGMKLHVEEQFTTIHNYIDTDAMVLRKGSVRALAGEQLIIPINMRDGSLICIGKGNEDWNCSAPHGAGRLMSRSKAKESFTVSQFKREMQGVYSTSINQGTLDEAPMAYKDMQSILDNIGPTAEVVKIIKPVYNFKAGEEN